ncbi:unnamed protein product, partial [Mesorhabditis belari]|uniref:Peptidase S1 domain-containing protein n=1 Tax=Mesorhabditis belari TaxID=2138241 RepID=A0AAF3E9J1_9BILA
MIAYNKELYRANYVHISPSYNPREQWYRIAKHDWALLQLERKIPLNDLNCQSKIRPVPSIWTNETDGMAKKKCFLIGFGQTEGEGDPTFNTVLIESTHRNAAACQGDSGAPVVCRINDKWYAIGLLIGGTFHSTHHKTHVETCLNIKRNAFVPFETLFSDFGVNGRTTPLMSALKYLRRFDDVLRFQKCH